MRYSEIHEAYWANNATAKSRSHLFEDAATKLAWDVIEFLTERAGFDHWWDDIDRGIRDDLFLDLVELFRKKERDEIACAKKIVGER